MEKNYIFNNEQDINNYIIILNHHTSNTIQSDKSKKEYYIKIKKPIKINETLTNVQNKEIIMENYVKIIFF